MKGSTLFLLSRSALAVTGALVLVSCSSPSKPAASVPAPQPVGPLKSLQYSGDHAAVTELDRAIAAARLDPAKLGAIRAELLALLADPAATFAGKQVAAERLGKVLPAIDRAADVPPVLTAMLGDDSLVNLARLALDPVPGAGVDAAYLDGATRGTGFVRLALVQSLGGRRSGAAVPLLGRLLADSEAGVAAAGALGQIGSAEALAALRGAPDPLAPAVLAAELRCAQALPGAEAAPALSAMHDNEKVPAVFRAAAFRGLLSAEPAKAPERIAAGLAGGDVGLRPVALEAIDEVDAPDMISTLAGRLAQWDSATQVAAIAAFGRKGDPAARPALLAAVHSGDPAIRTAALAAIGAVPGDREAAAALLEVIAGGSDDARLARQSLARLDGAGVSEFVLAGATDGEGARRLACIEQLGLRQMTDTVPLLLKMRREPDAAIRTAALGALGIVAPPETQPAIIDWAVSAAEAAEQTRALRTLVSVTERNHDAAARVRPIADALDRAAPEVQKRLLLVFNRIGGGPAADCVAAVAARDDAALAEAAATELARWPDKSGVLRLVAVAEKSRLAPVRAAAVQGAVKNIEASLERRSAEQSALVIRLLAVADDAAVRSRLAGLLGRAADEAALAKAKALASDPTVGAVARESARAIEANQKWPPVMTAFQHDRAAANIVSGTRAYWSGPKGDERWLQADFKVSRPLRRITLDQMKHEDEFPESYQVFVTDDPAAPGQPVAQGAGTRAATTVIDLPAGTHGRYLIIRNRQTTLDNWVVTQLLID